MKTEKSKKVKFGLYVFHIAITIFCLLGFVCLVSGGLLFGDEIGLSIRRLFLSCFGYMAFPTLIVFVYTSILSFIGSPVKEKKNFDIFVVCTIMLVIIALLVHLTMFPVKNYSFKEYVSLCWEKGQLDLRETTFGGIVLGAIIYPVAHFTTTVGAWIINIVLLLLGVLYLLKDKLGYANKSRNTNYAQIDYEVQTAEKGVLPTQTATEEKELRRGKHSSKLYCINDNFKTKPEGMTKLEHEEYDRRKNYEHIFGDGDSGKNASSYSKKYFEDMAEKRDYILTPPTKVDVRTYNQRDNSGSGAVVYDGIDDSEPKRSLFKPKSKQAEKEVETLGDVRASGRNLFADKTNLIDKAGEVERKSTPEYPLNHDVYGDPISQSKLDEYFANRQKAKASEERKDFEENVEEIESDVSPIDYSYDEPKKAEEEFDINTFAEMVSEEKPQDNAFGHTVEKPTQERPRDFTTVAKKNVKPVQMNFDDVERESNPYDLMPINYKYKAPPIDLLKNYSSDADLEKMQRFNREKSEIILSVLENNRIDARIVNVLNGPTVSRFDIEIPFNVSVNQVTKLSNDFNLRIAANGNIRIIAPIPNTQYIGIEIPNTERQTVGLREIVGSKEFTQAKKTTLTFALGKDLVGNAICLDIAKMPHLLIGGATGTGKSVCLNTLISSLLMKYGPDELRIMIVDPKMVEFASFEGIPHLMFNEMITTPEKAVAMLSWAVKEMEERYKLLYNARVQNINDYNEKMQSLGQKKMHRILLLIDEFADLMSTNKSSIEEKIGRLAQKARAAGIHLILATQRPSVDIMVGSIKTNFTSRISFKMATAVDSITILTESGAEALLGNGDCLYKTSTMFAVDRVQGAFISKGEMDAIINYVKDNNECYYNNNALREINEEANPTTPASSSGGDDAVSFGEDPDEALNYDALRYIIETNGVSTSKIQRKFKLGFNRAARVVDWMEENGYVSPPLENNKSRRILITMDQFESMMQAKESEN